MTSLQRVSRTGKLEAKSGAFESSFAAGLDLLEFGLTSKRQESAAAELLRVKMEESRQASQEEREESHRHGCVLLSVQTIGLVAILAE
jgi:hypothetical protein